MKKVAKTRKTYNLRNYLKIFIIITLNEINTQKNNNIKRE